MKKGFYYMPGKGSGTGGDPPPDGGGGDPKGEWVVYDHPDLGTVNIPVMAKFNGGFPADDEFNRGEVVFSLVELDRKDGTKLLAAYDVTNA